MYVAVYCSILVKKAVEKGGVHEPLKLDFNTDPTTQPMRRVKESRAQAGDQPAIMTYGLETLKTFAQQYVELNGKGDQPCRENHTLLHSIWVENST